ncbi:MAG: ABC transporter ATP-binding protein [Lachnospiraceae bacterium]|nr:ABC transporter ATP-binding protein [Lachnospiraceae bacterium]
MNHRWEVHSLNSLQKKGILLRLCSYVLHYWYLFIPAVILTLFSNQLSLLGPKYSGNAIDAIAAAGGVDMQGVWYNVVRMLVCYILSAVMSYLLATLMIFISQRIVYTMRKQVFEKLTSLPVGYFDTHPTGDIISHISYDIDTINSTLAHDLVQIMTSLYTVIGSLIFMWNISRPLILVFVITVPAAILFTRYRSKRVRPLFRTRSRKLGELNGYAEEMLSGCRSIQAYAREEVIGGRFDIRNTDAMDASYEADYYGAIMGPTVNFINNLSISLVMIMGGILYMYSRNGMAEAGSLFFITLGGVAQFVQYSRKFAGPINEFANILSEFQSAFSAAERVFRIIDEEPESPDAPDAVALEDVKGEVSFREVVFGYTPDKEILHGISLVAKPGQTIAIVGPTGAGKTTIISLLMRFYDVTGGGVTVDGIDVRNVTRKSLRHAYTMVLQDTWLFRGSIFENIAYGREGATLEEVKAAAKAARIDSYIESLPEGYDTVLTDDGINISKGQRQLITIARAMISDSEMLILDEATSNVDSRTEIKIQEAMAELMKGRTCFVIAHRLSTIQNADKIIVLQNGSIIEVGNHDELMKRGGFYSTLYNSQFS